MKKRHSIIVMLALLFTVPAFAVFNERDLGQTISVLRYELRQEYNKMSNAQSRIDNRNRSQHGQMVGMIKTCNELSLILYSQNQDFTFDITYALKEATREYEDFNKSKMPYDEIISRLDLEIERYSRLVESLRRLPPQLRKVADLPDSLKYHNDSLDLRMPAMPRPTREQMHNFHRPDSSALSGFLRYTKEELEEMRERTRTFMLDEQGRQDRDSCMFYATSLLKMFSEAKDRIVEDNEHYDEASKRLKESYDYAQDRYKVVQKRIFVDGQDNFFKVLGSFRTYVRKAFQDSINKYGSNLLITEDGAIRKSEWRGPAVIGFIGLVILCLIVSFFISFLLTAIARRFVSYLQTEDYRQHRTCLRLFVASVIFAVILMIAGAVIENNFFVLASKLLLVFAWLLAAILLSLLIRLSGEPVKAALKLYTPVIVMGLLVITFRIIFIPNSVVNLIFPPLLLFFFFWQLRICKRTDGVLPSQDRIIGWITLFVFAITTICAWIGYVLMSVQIMIWWLFQLSAIETVFALIALVRNYRMGPLYRKVEEARKNRPANMPKSGRGEFIGITWRFDLIKEVLLPIIAILSVPISIWMASEVFDLTSICKTIYFKPIVNLSDPNGNIVLHLSLYKIVLVTSMFFIFKYLNYVVKSIYHNVKIKRELKRSGTQHISTNQINFTLANNVIGILIWGTFIIAAVFLLKIPMGALSIIVAGLATGLGLAMKDILNNFIYGIQLMSGRLRVGDWVECDGFRGKVSAISYQSTQIELPDGAVMSFLNTALFNKNFKNLTRNNHYEFVKIVVGVNYGADVDNVRGILLDALKGLQVKDAYGRDIVDLGKGVTVAFEDFGDSSVDLAVKQFVLVSERVAYIAKAKEAIYKALNENSIEIPFPQRDIHIISSAE